MRKFLLMVIAALVGVSTLAACGNTEVSPFTLTDDLKGVSCENVVDVSNELDELAHAEASSDRDDALKAWGFDSAADDRVKTIGTSLLAKSKECNKTDNGEATVTDNGKKETVPLVNEASSEPSVDTTADPMTPASLPAGLCPTLVDWSTLVDCVDKNQLDWYIDGVNQRAKKTGFDWSDIVSWAEAKNADTAEVRAIEVFGSGISEKEARSRAAKLVGDDVAESLAIVRQPACFNNTRALEDGEMSDFVYCPPGSRQVRVSLLPAKMKNGKIVAIMDTDAGVFIDCDNLWWIPEVIKTPGNPPQITKPTPPKEEAPPERETPDTPGGGSPSCPPGQVGTPPICKDTQERQRTSGVGPGPNADPGPGTYVPSDQMTRPPATRRTDPTAPAPSVGNGNSGTGGSRPTPAPTRAPSPQPSAAPTNDPVRPDEGSGCAPGLPC